MVAGPFCPYSPVEFIMLTLSDVAFIVIVPSLMCIVLFKEAMVDLNWVIDNKLVILLVQLLKIELFCYFRVMEVVVFRYMVISLRMRTSLLSILVQVYCQWYGFFILLYTALGSYPFIGRLNFLFLFPLRLSILLNYFSWRLSSVGSAFVYPLTSHIKYMSGSTFTFLCWWYCC